MDDAEYLLHAPYLRRRGIRPAVEVTKSEPRIARVRRGVYASAERWNDLQDAERYRMLVLATLALQRTAPILCGLSAAVVWGLPIIGAWPETVEELVTSRGSGSTGRIVRRRVVRLPESQTVDGIEVTSPARTVVDIARSSEFVSALTAADAALRAGLCTTADLDREVAAIPLRARGTGAASTVVRLADARSESPGESLSRARMWELGLPQPDLQVPLHDERGAYGRADFGWDGVVGEFDGRVKYRADQMDGQAAEDTVWREKRREDRIRRHTRVVRWTWDDALRTRPMARVLADAGIRSTNGPDTWHRYDLRDS
ncbi:hypothetical protein [Allobranchiibius sp. GilTou38]|uniref:hypothetical protein n=1 Tax=Allobranchiibius sp. GilTou38 TaxID=2815210 RepID=UPI001AA14D1A|nr:hypothetical protein [Allobranchiibius sp. GilTou38]MBO1767947.1 hypothetical protein [Allobranchiibius sp. GilTou38]